MTVAGIVLAAGAGSRFGAAKALVTFQGELLVERAARLADAGGCEVVIVVLGAQADDVISRADLGAARCVVAEDWSSGIAASLRAGLAAAATTDAQAAAVILVDQPLIGAESLHRLRAAWCAGSPAAVATYAGQRCNPALLDRSLWSDVAAAAQGDVGARAWLRAHPDQVTPVECDGTGDPADVDTPEELAAMTAIGDTM